MRVESYATPMDLAAFTGEEPPAHADILLARASSVIDRILVAAIYDVDDDDELPTDAGVAAALREATCAQAFFMSRLPDLSGTSGLYKQFQLGSMSATLVTDSYGSPIQQTYSDQAVSILRVAGLTPAYISTSWY